ncbi:uncharacterized protein LOC100208603 [Hydra vulgaris]|uniref:uncharacterized protein LOC100208603 n=1 Tax=Hydra vulgaris TaxID=6087 RepID=UPI001F5EB79A|nr:uncharacterized protein LOC100208603 [Hydra vulgaris]
MRWKWYLMSLFCIFFYTKVTYGCSYTNLELSSWFMNVSSNDENYHANVEDRNSSTRYLCLSGKSTDLNLSISIKNPSFLHSARFLFDSYKVKNIFYSYDNEIWFPLITSLTAGEPIFINLFASNFVFKFERNNTSFGMICSNISFTICANYHAPYFELLKDTNEDAFSVIASLQPGANIVCLLHGILVPFQVLEITSNLTGFKEYQKLQFDILQNKFCRLCNGGSFLIQCSAIYPKNITTDIVSISISANIFNKKVSGAENVTAVYGVNDSNSILVSWKYSLFCPENYTQVKIYLTLEDQLTIKTVPANETFLLIDNLSPSSEYFIEVQLLTDHCESEKSSILKMTTMPGVPSPPINLFIVFTGSVLQLSWDAPIYNYNKIFYNVTLLGYKPFDSLYHSIRWFITQSTSLQNISASPENIYNVTVVAFNHRHTSNPLFGKAASMDFKRLCDPAPIQPTISEITPNSVTINIKAVNNSNCSISYYQIIVSETIYFPSNNESFGSYDVAKATGKRQYISKQIELFQEQCHVTIGDNSNNTYWSPPLKPSSSYLIFVRFISIWTDFILFSSLSKSISFLTEKELNLTLSVKSVAPDSLLLYIMKPSNVFFYQVIVSLDELSLCSDLYASYQVSTLMNSRCYMAHNRSLGFNDSLIFVGSETTLNGYFDRSLSDNVTYYIYFRYGIYENLLTRYSNFQYVVKESLAKKTKIKMFVDDITSYGFVLRLSASNFNSGYIQILGVKLKYNDSFTNSLYYLLPVTYEEAIKNDNQIPFLAGEFSTNDLQSEVKFLFGFSPQLFRIRRSNNYFSEPLERNRFYSIFATTQLLNGVLEVVMPATKPFKFGEVYPNDLSYLNLFDVLPTLSSATLSSATLSSATLLYDNSTSPTSTPTSPTTTSDISSGAKAAIISASVGVVILGFLIWILYKIRKYRNNNSQNSKQRNPNTSGLGNSSIVEGTNTLTLGKPNMTYETEHSDFCNESFVLHYEVDKKFPSVLMTNFKNYVESSKLNKMLNKQFEQLNDASYFVCSHGKDAANSHKNRYEKCLPTDRSRFILKDDRTDGSSDYINASIISSYKKNNGYIATQAPLPATIKDFWNMLWQSKSATIVMLCKRIEHGVANAQLYWPNLNQEEKYGKIHVKNNSYEKLNGYVIHTFEVQKKPETPRKVKLFHFIEWPDMSVPKCIDHLLTFREDIHKWADKFVEPLIVHCSAGVGRSGTFITIDALLENLGSSLTIDVFNFVNYLRSCRPQSVETFEQYEFIHDVILYYIDKYSFKVSKENVHKTYQNLKKVDPVTGEDGFTKYFKLLNRQLDLPITVANKPVHELKNRYSDKLPLDEYRVQLLITGLTLDETYINATNVNDWIISTQSPLESTIKDFWLMILCKNVKTILMLNELKENDNIYIKYYPNKQKAFDYGTFTIELKSKTILNQCLIRRCFTIKTADNEVFIVNHYQVKFFKINDYNRVGIINALKLMNYQEGETIVVHCDDGFGRTGSIIAVIQIIYEISKHGECNIMKILNALLSRSPFYLEKECHYKFIYTVLDEFYAPNEEVVS